jgi:hypothetical protein
LAHPRWRALLCEGQHWALLPIEPTDEPLQLRCVDVVLDLDELLWLRLRGPSGQGILRWWPAHCHLVVRRAQHPGLWPLLRAALAKGRRRHWWGAP